MSEKHFKNEINKDALSKALKMWLCGLDGNDGATMSVLDEIPYGDELNALVPWDTEGRELIDKAIGLRFSWAEDFLVAFVKGECEHYELTNGFARAIPIKVKDIMTAYDKIIAMANERYEAKHS